MTTTSKRNKYVREMKSSWWKNLSYYKEYMIREATSIPTIWFCIELLYGVIAAGKGEEYFINNFVAFLHNPLVILLNIITIAGVVFNTVTWFGLTPKALNIVRNNEKLPPSVAKNAMWLITIVFSVVALIIVYM